MAFVGSLIKAGISLNQKLNFDLKQPQEHQRDQLVKLLETARKTAFGKFYGFKELLKEDDVVGAFQESVPIHNYEQMHERWWAQQLKYPDITWPGKPQFYARSSGTTGKSSKRIPITDDFLQSIRDVGASLVRSLPNFDFPKELFETEILMLSSSANLDEQEGHFEGEISGINVSNFPGWYDWFYRPGKEIASIDNWDERIARIVEEAPGWDIGAIAGIPSWVLIMLQEIVKAHNLQNIHELWPNLTVYASGGVAYDTYREGFNKLCGKPIQVIDTYLASEGFFAYSARPDTMHMELALSHGYFYEFVPFDARGVDEQGNLLKHPEVHTLANVEPNQEYVLLVSSCAGAWRYMIGDTIKFTRLEPHEIKITGRTKFFLNVVGAQLSEEKMDAAIVKVSEQIGVEVNEYAVAAVKEATGYVHQWVIVCDQEVAETQFAQLLDQTLAEANKNYAVARSKALTGVQVKRITKQAYHEYLERTKKKGGQVKTPKVMTEEKMKSFMSKT